MLRKYPHTMIVPGDQAPSVRDDEGNWIEQQPTPPYEQKCMYQPQSSQQQKKVADGSVIVYNGIIFLPKDAKDIKPGVTIEVIGYITAAAGYFYRGQYGCTILL